MEPYNAASDGVVRLPDGAVRLPGDWEVLTVECQGPRPWGEDPPTSNHSPRRGYTSWVEPETGVRRDVEVVNGLASESQIRERRPRPATADMHCLEHAHDKHCWIGEHEGKSLETRLAKCEA